MILVQTLITKKGKINLRWSEPSQTGTRGPGRPYVGMKVVRNPMDEVVPGGADKPLGRPVVDPAASESNQILAFGKQQEWDNIWVEYNARFMNEDFVMLDDIQVFNTNLPTYLPTLEMCLYNGEQSYPGTRSKCSKTWTADEGAKKAATTPSVLASPILLVYISNIAHHTSLKGQEKHLVQIKRGAHATANNLSSYLGYQVTWGESAMRGQMKKQKKQQIGPV
ncbi:hypothetical protein BDP27DRAFT_1368644 [Rhodocollybia butyracea]|uniref:Uncharacterized protein n=1 Tax=Rhodocollybia butyracea TaxID=206335 RepID=A0A9P5U0K0_9AGAR|nr:hypothetical protein BDP27DRAFT_1368644 [Rhodocollybia butyracea]